MALASQRDTHYIISILDTPPDQAVVEPDFAPSMRSLATETDNPNWDRHKRIFEDQSIIENLLLAPSPSQPATIPLPTGGSVEVALSVSGTSTNIDYSTFELVTASGITATHRGRGVFNFAVSEAARSAVPNGNAFNVTASARARDLFGTWHTWNVTISTTGTQTASVPGPFVSGQPVPRTFSEGVQTTFSVPVSTFFTVDAAATPATYEVLNQDGTTLSGGWTLNSITSGVASITSPASGSTSKTVVYKVTDANGRTAQTSIVYAITANPLPVVISAITSISIDISQSGNFPLTGSSVIADPAGEALTYSMRNSDGTAPPAGYSYNGTNLAYPVEGGAVTRSFLIRATENGALGRTVDSAAFTFDRPALPVTIVTAADVTWPENATTVKRIDVRTILSTDAAEDITIPAAFSGKISKNAVGSGVFDLTGTFANNEIITATATYSGTAGGSPVQATPDFSSIHNPPVDGVSATLTINADQPFVLPVVDLSDDPATNLIVSGSASLDVGSVVISADFLDLTLTPEGPANATGTLTYTLEAGSGGPQTAVSRTVNWRAIVGPVANVASINTQSTDGVAFTPFDATAYWNNGSYAVDDATLKFYDTNDVSLGTSLTLPGTGTFSINASGVVSFTGTSGWVGTTALRLGISDVNGTIGDILSWNHTQVANPGDPPPGTIVPNTLDGKPIIQRGVESATRIGAGLQMLLKNQRQAIGWESTNAGSQQMWTTSTTSSAAKITASEFDPTTGWMKLAPGETTYFEQPRRYQGDTHQTVRTGDWSIMWDVRTGDTANASNFSSSWTETGTTTGNSGGQSDFINGGAAFTFARRRFVRTLSASDTTQAPMSLTNSSGSDIWVRHWYSGRVADETTWQTQPFTSEGLSDMGEEKVMRFMDISSPGGRAGRAVDLVQKDDYMFTANGRGFVALPAPSTTNSSYVRQGAPVYQLALGCVAAEAALWVNIPITLGMNVTDGIADGFYTSSATLDAFGTSAGTTAYGAVISNNFDAIIAEARVQYRLAALEWVQNLVDASYPDNYVFYVEMANEIWNGTFALPKNFVIWATRHLRNRTDGKPIFPNNGAYGAAGYMANLIATEFIRAVSELKPNQQIKFVLGAQTASGTGTMNSYCDGWNLYSQEFPTNSQPISRLAIATTSYLSGAFKWDGKSSGAGNPFGATTAASFVSQFNAAYAVSEDNLFQICRDWYINPTSRASSVYGQLLYISQHVASCASYGCEYVGNYEGSIHEDTDVSGSSQISGIIANVLQVRTNFIRGAYGEEITRKFIQEFFALYPNKIISNYYKYVRQNVWATGDTSWFEKELDEFDTAPTTGAAKAWYDYSRKGGGVVTPPMGLFSEDFETNDTTTELAAQGWTFGTGYGVVLDASQNSLFNATEFRDAVINFRSNAQANANLEFRIKFKPSSPLSAYFILEQSNTGDQIVFAPATGGHMSVSYLGQNAPIAITTTGVDFTDGSYHDILVSYYADAVNGVIQVENAVDNTIYASTTEDTTLYSSVGASQVIVDKFIGRGLNYYASLSDVTDATPPTPVDAQDTLITLDHAAGSQAGLPVRLTGSDFPGGAAHDFFQNAQTDGGDIRVYLDDATTRLPVHVFAFNKAAGTCDIRFRDASARAQNYTWRLRSGGVGSLTQPAADEAYGSKAVYADFDLYTIDMTVNHVDGEIFVQAGGAAVSGPNGLSARGYDSQGVNAGDASTSTITTNEAALSSGVLFYRSAAGGGGVGIADTGFARLFHQQNGDDLYLRNDNGRITLEREFSTTDSNWATAYSTLNTWAGFCYSHDGSTGAPTFTLNKANAAVTTVTAPVGTFVPGNTTLIMGNHNGFNRNWDGRLCEYWRMSATTSQAYHVCWQTNLLNPDLFLSIAASGGSTYTPELQAVLAQMSTQPDATRAQLYDDEIVIPLKAAGVWDKLDVFYLLGVHDSQAATLNWIDPVNFALVGTASPTFTTDRGFNYNGTTQWHDTQYQPSLDGINWSINAASMGVWSRGTGQSTNGAIGSKRTTGSTSVDLVNPRTTGDLFATRINDATSFTVANASASGLYAVSREGASLKRMYKNGAQVGGDSTTASTNQADYPLLVGGVGGATNTSYAGDLFAAFAGGALTSTDMAAIHSALDSYRTAVGA